MCVPPSGATLFKSIKQASPGVQVNKQAGRPPEVCTLLIHNPSWSKHAGNLQERLPLTTSGGRDSHPARHISRLIISLPGGYSLTSVSSARCRLNAAPSNIRQPLWILALDVRPSPWIHSAQEPSHRDTRHLGPQLNYTEAPRNASGLAFVGVQI